MYSEKEKKVQFISPRGSNRGCRFVSTVDDDVVQEGPARKVLFICTVPWVVISCRKVQLVKFKGDSIVGNNAVQEVRIGDADS